MKVLHTTKWYGIQTLLIIKQSTFLCPLSSTQVPLHDEEENLLEGKGGALRRQKGSANSDDELVDI